jgi:hypothetical protein
MWKHREPDWLECIIIAVVAFFFFIYYGKTILESLIIIGVQ